IHYKKNQYSFKEKALCFMAGLCCICAVLYAYFLLYPFAEKVMEYLTDSIGVMNNAIKVGYR
ncbi:MAG: hypothetical protein ABIU77_08305, partial [Ferruginibacter sp.]